MIVQVVNLSNPRIVSAYQTKSISLRDLSFVPAFGVEVRSISKYLIDQITKILDGRYSVNLFSLKQDEAYLIVFRSLNDLIEISKDVIVFPDSEFQNEFYNALNYYISFEKNLYRIGYKQFRYNRPCLMGILNVTPDSFSDAGKYFETSAAIEHGLQLLEDGADIVDIGGESTRPGANEVSEDDELKRVIPVIEGIIKQKPFSLISIDTTKSSVAKAALKSGAVMINDISGLTFDNKIAEVAQEHDASLVIMHINGTPRDMQLRPQYNDLIGEIYDYLYLQSEKAKSAGVKNILIDPGIGFGKTVEHNLDILSNLDSFRSLGFPIMIGLSKKSFLGKTFKIEINEREIPTVIAEAFALVNGASIIRTHNIKNAKKLQTIHRSLN